MIVLHNSFHTYPLNCRLVAQHAFWFNMCLFLKCVRFEYCLVTPPFRSHAGEIVFLVTHSTDTSALQFLCYTRTLPGKHGSHCFGQLRTEYGLCVFHTCTSPFAHCEPCLAVFWSQDTHVACCSSHCLFCLFSYSFLVISL